MEYVKQLLKEIANLSLEVLVETKDNRLRLIRRKAGEALGIILMEER